MQLNKTLLTILFFFLTSVSFSQVIVRDPITQNILNANQSIKPIGSTSFDFGNHNRDLSINNINYNDIDGSPFWNDDYMIASLYNDKLFLGSLPIRINLATDEVYFLRNENEFVLDSGIVTKISFIKITDSIVFANQIENIFINSKPIKKYVQILNVGKYQLIKYVTKKLKKSEIISPAGSMTYSFSTDINYFIKRDGIVDIVKRLNKDNIYKNLPGSSRFDLWAKERKINFKSEKDVIEFLNYYNSIIK